LLYKSKKILNQNLGFTASVDWNNGTPFGNALANSFVERAWYKDLNRIVTRVCIY
jgi:hypothetical protein